MIAAWTDTLLQGLMLGGLYALFATGLSLTFGVMRLVNIAHGDLSILAAFIALVRGRTLGLSALALAGPGRAGDGSRSATSCSARC